MQTTARFTAVLACVLGAAFAARPARAAAPASETRPDLSGHWRLNEKESDDPRALRGDRPRGPGGGGFGRGGGFGGGGFGRGGGGRGGDFPGRGLPGGEGEGGARPNLERMQARFRELTITYTEPVLRVTYGDERDDTFYTDGRTVKREDERGFAEVRARWKDRRVVIERQTRRGKATETLERTSDGRRLLVTTRMSAGPMGAMTIKRIYDLAPEEPAPATPGQ